MPISAFISKSIAEIGFDKKVRVNFQDFDALNLVYTKETSGKDDPVRTYFSLQKKFLRTRLAYSFFRYSTIMFAAETAKERISFGIHNNDLAFACIKDILIRDQSIRMGFMLKNNVYLDSFVFRFFLKGFFDRINYSVYVGLSAQPATGYTGEP